MNIVILEDEELASDRLQSLIQEVEPGAVVKAVLQSVESASEWFSGHEHPDLIFSDIQLLDGVSFDVFKTINVTKPIIFTTAYDQYAIKAFEHNSVDYLLKPVQKEKLANALAKYKSMTGKKEQTAVSYEQLLTHLMTGKASYKTRFMVRLGQKILSVPVDTIAYFYSESKLTYLVTSDGKRLPIDPTLEEIETQLDPALYFRANRQFVVRIDAIAEIHPYFKGRVKIKVSPDTEHEIVISSEKAPEFKKWLDR
jgi:two-component system, LytTR family, response regulator LytT